MPQYGWAPQQLLTVTGMLGVLAMSLALHHIQNNTKKEPQANSQGPLIVYGRPDYNSIAAQAAKTHLKQITETPPKHPIDRHIKWMKKYVMQPAFWGQKQWWGWEQQMNELNKK